MSQSASSDLFASNIAALRSICHTALVDAVLALPAHQAIQGGDPLTPLQRADGTHLYAHSPEENATAQILDFRKSPTRFFTTMRSVPPDSQQVSHSAMRKILSGMQGQFLNAEPDPSAGHMICLGIGSGHHIPILLDGFPFFDLIVLEPNLGYFLHSLYSIDWAGIIAELQSRGGTLTVLAGRSPLELAQAAVLPIRSKHFAMLDGMYVFVHYRDDAMERTIAELKSLLPVIEGNDGFFEDEQIMLRQAVETETEFDHYLLYDKTDRGLKEIPVFVVGAGPSLDDTIADIKRNRDNVVLMSCSTSLRPLLKAGLIPDFHAEVENTEDAATIVQDAASDFDISQIVLLATNTVRADVLQPFERKVLYWREAVVPSRLFSSHEEHLNLAGPTAANLAIRAGVSMGFYEFYLFGIDMGARDPSQHHASDSIYYDRDDAYWTSGAQMEPFTLPIPGNMRETVYTNRSFLFCKMFFDRLFQLFPNHFFFNCADGARFDCCPPISSKDVTALPPAQSRAAFVQNCLDQMDNIGAGQAITPALLSRYHAYLEAWFEEAFAITNAVTVASTQTLIQRFQPILAPASSDNSYSVDAAAKGLLTGTVLSILQFGYFLERRVDQAEREKFQTLFRAAFVDALSDMKVQSLRLADELISLTSE